MSDRTVRVTLTAQVQGYLQGIDQVQRKTREAGSEVEKLAQKRQAFQTLGVSALALGTAIAAGIGLAVVKYAEFDQAMSNANAILQETTANQALLRDAALEAGGATVFTATESANAIEELGKAGIGTSDILSGALTGSLDLAASAQLGVARAAEISGITLKQFALDGTQAGRVADVLSAGANKAVGSVDDLANGLKFVGPVAKGMNVSLEDTVATLALFADRGVIGEQAGTSLRGMLSSLTSPSKAAKQELDALGVSLYDGQGRFKGLENVAGELNRALAGASDAERDMALGVIFGNQQVTAARILVDAGAETWRDYRNAVDDSGIASRIAAERMDNLAGDVEKLGGAFDTALIQTGSGANDVLRELVQGATWLVDRFGELPEPVLGVGLAVGVAGAALALATGIVFTGIPKWAAFKQTLDDLSLSGRKVALGVGVATAAVTLGVIALSAWASSQAEAKARVDAFADSLDQASAAITDNTREVAKAALAANRDGNLFWGGESAYQAAEKLGIALDDVTDAALGNADALDRVKDAAVSYQDVLSGDRTQAEFDAAVKASGLTQSEYVNTVRRVRDSIQEQSDALAKGRDVVEQKTKADQTNAEATQDSAEAYLAANDEAAALNNTLQGLLDTLSEANGANQDAISANLDYLNALADVDDAIEKARSGVDGYALTLDTSTQAGRDNMEMLLGLARQAEEAAEAQFQLDGNTQNFQAALEASRDALIKRAEDLGYTSDQAADLADKILAIPTESEWKLIADTSAASRAADTFVRTYDGKTITMKLSADQVVVNGRVYGGLRSNYMGGVYKDGVQAFAQGGFPSGIYPYTPGGIHKFAEASDETYISFLPQYRQRNVGIWAETGERLGVWRTAGSSAAGAASVAPAQVTVVVQPKGGIDLLKYIDVSIENADSSRQRTLGAGRQVR